MIQKNFKIKSYQPIQKLEKNLQRKSYLPGGSWSQTIDTCW